MKIVLIVFLCISLLNLTVNASEVSLKDFHLGMSTDEIEQAINSIGLKKSGYGDRLYNQCSNSDAEYKVVPMIEGGMSSVKPHLFDQACQLQEYDLLGSTSEVNIMLHENKLVWAHFYTTGTTLLGSNETLISALNKKYGQATEYKYRSLFGQKSGYKWVIDGARILLKSSSLTLESKSGRGEFKRREAALNDTIESTL